MVEEFMLLANVSVAKKIYDEFSQCAVLRRHPLPPYSNFDPMIAVCKAYVSIVLFLFLLIWNSSLTWRKFMGVLPWFWWLCFFESEISWNGLFSSNPFQYTTHWAPVMRRVHPCCRICFEKSANYSKLMHVLLSLLRLLFCMLFIQLSPNHFPSGIALKFSFFLPFVRV